MKPRTLMLIAGETSGDILAAGLVSELRRQLADATPAFYEDRQPLRVSLEPRFFGAGGARMAAAGVELAFDLTRHSVIGVSDVFKKLFEFRRLFHQLLKLAMERRPDAIVCVDFSGFNRRFAQAVRSRTRAADWFHNWQPKIVQFVSPQVWASRPSRAYQMERDHDLLLTIFPFEKDWYARRVPRLRVEFVGHPFLDRYPRQTLLTQKVRDTLLLLPGSRPAELTRHVPVMLRALELIGGSGQARNITMVVPEAGLAEQAKSLGVPPGVVLQVGGLPEALSRARVAVASTGTVTMECALFGVPTVAIYKTSWSTYQIAKRIVKVKFLAMPNILADERIFPEFIQEAATGENIAQAVLELWESEAKRAEVADALQKVVGMLGSPGATVRAARAIVDLVEAKKKAARA